MAEYPKLAPTLNALYATKDDPQPTEAASKLDDVLRQERNWLYDFLSQFIDPTTNTLKPVVFQVGTTIPAGSVRGSEANNGAQREILQGSISTPDLRADAVTENKIASGAVTSAKLGDQAVETTRIHDLAVTTAKVADKAITGAKIADNTITGLQIADNQIGGSKLADNSVTSVKIGANQITGQNLQGAGAGVLLVGGNSNDGTAAGGLLYPRAISGAITIDRNGIATLTTLGQAGNIGYFYIAEMPANNTAGGASIASATDGSYTQKRGVAIPWNIPIQTIAGVIEVGTAGKIKIKLNGTYRFQCSAPAAADQHRIRLSVKKDGNSTDIAANYDHVFGTSELSVASSVQTRSFVEAVFQIVNASAANPALFVLEHWTKTAVATNGLGWPCASGAGETEVYATIEIIKLQ